MRVLALDQAKVMGYAVFDDKELIAYGCVQFGKRGDTYETLLLPINNYINSLIETYEPELVVMEDVQQQQNASVYKKLAMLLGSVILSITQKEMLYEIIHPTVWKSICSIRGRKRDEQKQNTIRFVEDKFNIENIDSDTADAIAIGWAAAHNIVVKRG